MTSAWTSGIVAGVGTCVGTWGHRAPCNWVEAGRAAWCAEGGLTLLCGVRITGEGDSTAVVRGSNTLLVGSMAVVRGSKTLVGGSTASAFDDTFWSVCALQGERHTSEEVWRLTNSRPWSSFCLLQTCPISPSARWLTDLRCVCMQ